VLSEDEELIKDQDFHLKKFSDSIIFHKNFTIFKSAQSSPL